MRYARKRGISRYSKAFCYSFLKKIEQCLTEMDELEEEQVRCWVLEFAIQYLGFEPVWSREDLLAI